VVWQGQFSVVRRRSAEQMACITVEVHETGTMGWIYGSLCDLVHRMFEFELVVVTTFLLRI
jgi:hypothetical protein